MLVLGVLASVSLSACGGDGEDSDQAAGTPDASAPAPSPGPSPASGDEAASAPAGTPVRIRFGDTELTARLDDNATARDLAAQLPLTLTFRDHNNVEKTAPLPSELSLEGAPEGHDPAAGEIGYWAPDGDLVFYYSSDAPFFNGIVRIGEFDAELGALASQNEDFSAAIERADSPPRTVAMFVGRSALGAPTASRFCSATGTASLERAWAREVSNLRPLACEVRVGVQLQLGAANRS